MQQLNSNEIGELFKFVQSKNVPHLDVQYEIVDHLASDIESMKSENPNLSFKQALEGINNSIPITGFWKIQLEKQKSMRKFWTRRILKYHLNYMTLPKIMISMLLFIGFKTFFDFTGSTGIIIISIIMFIILEIMNKIWLDNDSKNFNNYLVSKSLTYSLKTILYIFSWIPFILIWELLVKDSMLIGNNIGALIPYISIAFVIMTLLIHASYFVFPKMLEKEINLKYQHLKFQ